MDTKIERTPAAYQRRYRHQLPDGGRCNWHECSAADYAKWKAAPEREPTMEYRALWDHPPQEQPEAAEKRPSSAQAITRAELLATIAREMRERRVGHGGFTSPTLAAWADRIEAIIAWPAGAGSIPRIHPRPLPGWRSGPEPGPEPGPEQPVPVTPASIYLQQRNGCAGQDWQDGFNAAFALLAKSGDLP